MADWNKLLPLIRTGVLGTVLLFTLIVFVISAHIIWWSNTWLGGYYSFSALSLATSIITFLSVPVMLILSLKRKGAFTSRIAFEFGFLTYLWIMWLASAAQTANTWWVNACTGSVCSEAQAIEAFGFLNWLMLMAYTITLLVHTLLAANKGRKEVWKSEVRLFDWNATTSTKPSEGGVVHDAAAPVAGSPVNEKVEVGTAPAPVPVAQPQYLPQGVPVSGAPPVIQV